MENGKAPWYDVKREVISTLNMAVLFMIEFDRPAIKRMIKVLHERPIKRAEAISNTRNSTINFFKNMSKEERQAYIQMRGDKSKSKKEWKKTIQKYSGRTGTRFRFTPETGRMIGKMPSGSIFEDDKK
jgi:hypothetical protein